MEATTILTTEEMDRTQEKLELLLKELAKDCLAKDDPRIPAIVSRLHKMYVPAFRHRYSKIFPLLVDIDDDKFEGNLDYLSNNIIAVRKYVDCNCTSGDGTYQRLYKPLMKLSDHLNLEIARYNHFVGQNKEITELKKENQELQKQLADATKNLTDATKKLQDAEPQLKTIETDLPTAMSDLDTVKKSLSSIHIDIIAVLSIFASIVLTFSGSMTVLGSALTGMQEVHALKATFFVLLCGFVLGNIIFLLMYLVGKLTSRNIYARCKTENCTCGTDGAPACRGLKRIRKRLPYIYWLNVILIGLMVVVVVVWYLDNHLHFIH